MKTYVFVFVPVKSEEHFDERLRECLATVPDSSAPASSSAKTAETSGKESFPFWTWFVSNPLPTGGDQS